MNTPIIDAGAAIAIRTPPDALLATVEYERYGSNSPMLLYFAHRKGWSFDQTSISPSVIAHLKADRGVCYVAVGDWPSLEAMRPDVIEFLRPYPHVDLPYTQQAFQLVALCEPATARLAPGDGARPALCW